MQQNNEHKNKNLEEKVALVKRMVNETLEILDETEREMEVLQKLRNTLKRDLMDLKEGRLDRIEERHSIDQSSKKASLFTVEKKIMIGQMESNAWYIPFLISFKKDRSNEPKKEVTNSITKLNASGSYKLNNGEVRYL